MIERPLYDAVCAHAARSKARLHMPGHGGIGDGSPLYASARFDLTELEGLDNLLAAQGVIRRAEDEMTRVYRTKRTLMLTSGCTSAMQIAAALCARRGKRVLACGAMHKSFWNACALFGLRVSVCAEPSQARAILSKSQSLSAIFVTSPDYCGYCADLASLRALADEFQIMLVADAAHGAHFAYASAFPRGAERVADIAVSSMHKTLPVYGGGALLHLGETKLSPAVDEAEYFRQFLHTSSPDYLVMASMDYARALMEARGETLYRQTVAEICDPSHRWGGLRRERTDDPTRLVLSGEGVDGARLLSALHARGVDLETAIGNRIVAIVTPFQPKALDLLDEALGQIEIPQSDRLPFEHTCARGQTDGKTVAFCRMEDAVGKVSAAELGVYPPGVPIVHIGDVIDAQTLEYLICNKSCVFGLVNGGVAVLQ